jgi:hypothetical protein
MYIIMNDVKLFLTKLGKKLLNKFKACNFLIACCVKIESMTPWSEKNNFELKNKKNQENKK